MVTIALLYGGRSGEHDVSRCSAAAVFQNLDPAKFRVVPVGIDRSGIWHVQPEPLFEKHPSFGTVLGITSTGPWYANQFQVESKLVLIAPGSKETISCDIVFPVMHGTFAEDGTLQGFLELAMVPFVASGMTGSVLGMDKDIAKRLVRDAGVPVVPWITVAHHDWISSKGTVIKNAENLSGYPLFVKPANAGSSVGVSRATSSRALAEAMDEAFRFDNRVLIEKGLAVEEIECAILGNDNPEVSVIGKVIPRHEFYSYEAKYIDPHGADLEIPAAIDEKTAGILRDHALTVFKALHGKGLARIDFFIDKRDGRAYFNEINTLPGFTSISMYAKLWGAAGLAYGDLLDRLIEFGFEDHAKRMRLTQEF